MRWDDADWRPWRPEDVTERLAGVDAPWYVAAGWAIDLYLGGERREHEDLEIGVPAEHAGAVLAALGELDFYVPSAGSMTPSPRRARRSRNATRPGGSTGTRTHGGSTSSASRRPTESGSAGATPAPACPTPI